MSTCQPHLIIEKYEIHLNENECHSGGRCQCQHHIMAFGVTFQFEILSKLQARVNHAANAECCTHRKKQK